MLRNNFIRYHHKDITFLELKLALFKTFKYKSFFYLEALCVRLEMEFHSDCFISQEHIDTAVKFGVDLSSLGNPIDAKKYVLAFIQKLLLQREKLDLGVLIDHLKSEIITLWKDVLSTLENSDRRLLAVESGSLIFILFCPTVNSARELTNDSWIKYLAFKMENLLKEIG